MATPKKKSKVKECLCVVCGKKIPQDRISALEILDISKSRWTHVNCSMDKKKQGIYMGEVGTSELKVVDKVYNDSVREIFTKTTQEQSEEEPD
jgi:hypothetical protein